MLPSLFCEWLGRWNSPYINHFISADTIVPDQTNSQDLNRYSYVNNDPLRYTDPTGHLLCGDGEEHDCNGHKQDPNQNPHPPKPPKPKKDEDDEDILDPKTNDDTGEELTTAQLVGQVITFGLIETTIFFPVDIALVDLTADATAACLDGIAIACIADIPIGALDIAVADFQISLGATIVQNVATHTKHDFKLLIIPKIFDTFPR
jgi:hypothetical protein